MTGNVLEIMADKITDAVSTNTAIIIAFTSVIIWAITDNSFTFSDGCQFVLSFIILRSQKKNSLATHVKLDELIRSKHNANNSMINLEAEQEANIKAAKEELSNVK